jgi:putative flippase GtrA
MRGQVLRLLLDGGANTLATYAVFFVLGLFIPAWIAYTIAFAIGLVWVVFGSSRYVFRGQHGARRLLSFAAWYLVIYAIGRVVIALIAPVDAASLALASVAVLAVTTPLTFVGGRLILGSAK